MDHLTESAASQTLWPFGHDKRMLFAIHAHINTILKQQRKLNIPGPVLLKLKTLCSTLMSLLNILTGMNTKSTTLDFELSSMFEALDDAVKQLPNHHMPSYSENRSTRSQTVHIPSTKTKAKRRKNNGKKKRKRRGSQHVVIYDLQHENPYDSPVSDLSESAPVRPLNMHIIEDYKSDASILSDVSTVSPRDSGDTLKCSKSRSHSRSHSRSKSDDSAHGQSDFDPHFNALQFCQYTKYTKSSRDLRMPSTPCSLWKAPALSAINVMNTMNTRSPMAYRNMNEQDGDADSESFSAAESSLDSIYSSNRSSTSFATTCLPSSVSSIHSLSNSRARNVREQYRIEAVDSDIEIEMGLDDLPAALTAGCLAERRSTERDQREHRPRRRSKAKLMNERDADLVDRCRLQSIHDGVFGERIPERLGMGLGMELEMTLEREARNTEGEDGNESIQRPPLPKKADKTVALQVVSRSWRERRKRPLPKPNPR